MLNFFCGYLHYPKLVVLQFLCTKQLPEKPPACLKNRFLCVVTSIIQISGSPISVYTIT